MENSRLGSHSPVLYQVMALILEYLSYFPLLCVILLFFGMTLISLSGTFLEQPFKDFITRTAYFIGGVDNNGKVDFVRVFFVWYFILSLILSLSRRFSKFNVRSKYITTIFWIILVLESVVFACKVKSFELGAGAFFMAVFFYWSYNVFNNRVELLRQ